MVKMSYVDKKIILRCQGGFCNRIRAIVSAVLWAEDIGTSLEVYWPVEKGHMPCAIDELIDVRSISRLTGFHDGYIRAKQVLSSDDMIAAIDSSSADIIIQSYSTFHPDLQTLTERGLSALRRIKVAQYLQDMADIKLSDKEYIGIHVRRTDHVKCIEASPLEAFERHISNILISDSYAKFVLCTDETYVKQRFSQQFGSSILSPIDTLGRMTSEQQKLGVVDWLLLQKCSKIYASAGSSFSELAAWRAGIELLCV